MIHLAITSLDLSIGRDLASLLVAGLCTALILLTSRRG